MIEKILSSVKKLPLFLLALLAGIYYVFKESYWEFMYRKHRKKYNIPKSFCFNGDGINFNGNGKIIIGDNTYMGKYSYILSFDNCEVRIGDNCAISHYVSIYTCNYDASEIINCHSMLNKKTGNVIIGNNCWIGRGVLINLLLK